MEIQLISLWKMEMKDKLILLQVFLKKIMFFLIHISLNILNIRCIFRNILRICLKGRVAERCISSIHSPDGCSSQVWGWAETMSQEHHPVYLRGS